MQHLDGVAADGVHLRVELDGEHAVAEIDEARPRIPADHALPIFRGLQNLQAFARRRQRAVTEAVAPRSQDVGDERGQIGLADCFGHFANADRVPDFERAELPAESPLHRPVDVVYRVGDGGCDARSVEERRAKRGAQESAHLVAAQEQRLDPFAGIVDRARRVERRQTGRLPGAVGECRGIERQDLRFPALR